MQSPDSNKVSCQRKRNKLKAAQIEGAQIKIIQRKY